MTIEVIPLSEFIGAEVKGADLSTTLGAEIISAIENTWNQYSSLLFCDSSVPSCHSCGDPTMFATKG